MREPEPPDEAKDSDIAVNNSLCGRARKGNALHPATSAAAQPARTKILEDPPTSCPVEAHKAAADRARTRRMVNGLYIAADIAAKEGTPKAEG